MYTIFTSLTQMAKSLFIMFFHIVKITYTTGSVDYEQCIFQKKWVQHSCIYPQIQNKKYLFVTKVDKWSIVHNTNKVHFFRLWYTLSQSNTNSTQCEWILFKAKKNALDEKLLVTISSLDNWLLTKIHSKWNILLMSIWNIFHVSYKIMYYVLSLRLFDSLKVIFLCTHEI